MLHQLLNAITARASGQAAAENKPIQMLDLARVRAVTEREVKPKVRSYPRSVCTSLKDLCEL
jgi:hypothetical protein